MARKTNPTIKLAEETKAQLDRLKLVKREPYDSVIQRLIKVNFNVQEQLRGEMEA